MAKHPDELACDRCGIMCDSAGWSAAVDVLEIETRLGTVRQEPVQPARHRCARCTHEHGAIKGRRARLHESAFVEYP